MPNHSIRWGDEELQAVNDAASRRGVNASEFIRSAALDEAHRTSIPADKLYLEIVSLVDDDAMVGVWEVVGDDDDPRGPVVELCGTYPWREAARRYPQLKWAHLIDAYVRHQETNE